MTIERHGRMSAFDLTSSITQVHKVGRRLDADERSGNHFWNGSPDSHFGTTVARNGLIIESDRIMARQNHISEGKASLVVSEGFKHSVSWHKIYFFLLFSGV